MPHLEASVSTADGVCPVHLFTAGDAPRPGVLFYMDALTIRPALFEMAQRLADAGYAVLLPDLFYRYGPHAPLDPTAVFAGDFRATVGPLMATTDNAKAAADTAAFLAFLDERAEVAPGPVGAVGFCMGGGMALYAAGQYPDRIRAVASFHGGNLATEAATSPHRQAPSIRAEVYVAGADADAHYPPEMAAALDEALTDNGVVHHCEIYKGAQHGWMMPDFPIHDRAAAERGWDELLALFGRVLG